MRGGRINREAVIVHGIAFKSKLEANVYSHINNLGFNIQYEPVEFVVADGFKFHNKKYLPIKYTPDFRISHNDREIWIETKGFMMQQDAMRIKLFKKLLSATTPFAEYYVIASVKEAVVLTKWLKDEESIIDKKELVILKKIKRSNGT